MAKLVDDSCNRINGDLTIILNEDGSGFLKGPTVTAKVNSSKAEVRTIQLKIQEIQTTLASNPETYKEKLALLEGVTAELIKAEEKAKSDGVSRMLSPEGQAAQQRIINEMAKAKRESAPTLAAIKNDTPKLKKSTPQLAGENIGEGENGGAEEAKSNREVLKSVYDEFMGKVDEKHAAAPGLVDKDKIRQPLLEAIKAGDERGYAVALTQAIETWNASQGSDAEGYKYSPDSQKINNVKQIASADQEEEPTSSEV